MTILSGPPQWFWVILAVLIILLILITFARLIRL